MVVSGLTIKGYTYKALSSGSSIPGAGGMVSSVSTIKNSRVGIFMTNYEL